MPRGRRPRQVGELLQAAIAEALGRDLRDPRVGFVTVTGVEVSTDLHDATVFVSVLDGAQEGASLAALEQAAGFLRRSLAGRIYLKQIPRLTFRADRSIREGAHMEELLSDLRPATEDE